MCFQGTALLRMQRGLIKHGWSCWQGERAPDPEEVVDQGLHKQEAGQGRLLARARPELTLEGNQPFP